MNKLTEVNERFRDYIRLAEKEIEVLQLALKMSCNNDRWEYYDYLIAAQDIVTISPNDQQ